MVTMNPKPYIKSCLIGSYPVRWWQGFIVSILIALPSAQTTAQSDISFQLRSTPLFEYFITSMNGYTFYVKPDFFFGEMPKVLDYADVDSTRKQEMRAEIQQLSARRGICGDKSHMHMKGDWRPVFERFVANNLRNGEMFHIAHERSGRIVNALWYTKQMKTAHGPGKYRYYADADHRELVFTLKVRPGGRPITNF